MPLADDVAAFIHELRSNRKMSPNTVRNYATDLAQYLRYSLGVALPGWGDASPEHFKRFLATMDVAGYSIATRERRRCSIRSFHAWLFDSARVETDAGRTVRGARRGTRIPRALPEQDIERILRECGRGASGARDAAMIEVAYGAGLRVSELCGLRLADLDMPLSQARVYGKGSERIVPLGRKAMAALSLYLDGARTALLHGRESDAVFLSNRGRQMSPRAFRERLAQLARDSGLRARANPHALRHSAATHMYRNGAGLIEIKELLGHRSIETTLVYTHVDRTRIRAAQRKFHPRG